MKLMRRTLALLLVAATLLGMSLTAGAATVKYTDAGSITHAAAVDILSGLGVIKGYANGSFKPASSVTRAEVSKMLAIVLNGGEDVGEMYLDACTFADAKDHWGAGYIGYCVSAGIISGKNASTFDPDGKLTGYELSKLLLCTLGYKADLNGLTGPNWDKNAHMLAIKTKLLDYLKDYAPEKNISREDTCQMIFNALLATKVETSGSTTSFGKVTIASNVENTALINNTFDYRGAGSVDGYLQLVEDVLPELKQLPGAHDYFGRPASSWRLGGTDLGTYIASRPIAAQEGNLNTKALRNAFDGNTPERVEFFQNGVLTSTADEASMMANLGVPSLSAAGSMDLLALCAKFAAMGHVGYPYAADMVLAQLQSKTNNTMSIVGNATSTNSLVPGGAYGEYYYDEETRTLTICSSTYHYGRIVQVRPETYDANGDVLTPSYVVLDNAKHPGGVFGELELADGVTVPASGTTVSLLTSQISFSDEGASLEPGNYVLYCYGFDAANGWNVVDHALGMSVATETIDRATYYTTNGTTRTYPNAIRGTSKTSYSRATIAPATAVTIGKAYTIYYALFNNTARFFFLESADADGVYVYNAGKTQNTVPEKYQAKIVNADGSVEIVDTDINYGPMGANLVGSVAIPSKNALGQVVLTATGNYSGNTNVRASVTNKVSAVNFDGTTKYADETTRFVVGTIDSMGAEVFTAYNGISKVPTIGAVKYYAYTENPVTGRLDTVFFVNASSIIGSAEQEGVLVKTGKESSLTDVTGTYYVMQTIVGKEASSFKVSQALYNSLPNGFTLFAGYTKDSEGLVSALNKVTGTKITAFAPVADGIITLNGNPLMVHENILVYTYSVMRDKLELSTVESLYAPNATFDSFFTRHEHLTNKPLASIFMVID